MSPEHKTVDDPGLSGEDTPASEGLMRSSSVSMLRGATWLYVGSLVTIGGIALASLCYNLLTLALNLASSVVGQIPRPL